MVRSNSVFKSIFLCFLIMFFSNVSLYQTPFSLLLNIVIPCFMAYLTYTLGIVSSAVLCGAICSFNIITAFFISEMDLFMTAISTLMVVLPGFICGLLISKKACVRDVIITVAFTVIIFPLLALAYAKYTAGFDFTKEMTEFFNTVFYEQFDLIKSVYPEFDEIFSTNKSEIFSMISIAIPGLIPAVAAMIAMIYSVLIFMFSKVMLKQKLIANSFFIQGLDSFYIPKINTTVLILLIVLLFLETNSLMMMAIINVFVIILGLFMLEGLSLIDSKLKHRIPNSIIRFIALIGIIIALSVASAIMPILNPFFALSIVGISDSINDYRKINSNKDEKNEI